MYEIELSIHCHELDEPHAYHFKSMHIYWFEMRWCFAQKLYKHLEGSVIGGGAGGGDDE